MRVIIYRDKADEWRWRLVHQNGNTLADSGEGYHNLTDLQDTLTIIFEGRVELSFDDSVTIE